MTNHENEIRNLLALAEEHEEANDFTAVKESLQQAQALSQKYRNEKFNLICGYNYGTCLVNTGEPRKGVESLLKVISLLPENDQKVINEQNLYYNLGIGLAYVGEWNSCFETMKKIVNPNLYAKAAMTRGKAAERMRMFDVALEELKTARESAHINNDWGTVSKAWFIESKVNQNIHDTKKARKALKEAAVMTERINNEAEKREHRALIGEALIEAQLYDEALPTLLGAQSENTPKTHYLIANNYAKLRKWPEAIEQFENAARGFLMENNLEMAGLCYAGEGKAHLKLKQFDRALALYKSALTTFEEITFSSIRKSNGLWNSNAGIGESLYKLGHYGDCIGPIKESVALLEAEKRNIDLEVARLKQFLRRATRKTGSVYGGESDSSVATVATSIQPPRILNTLQSSNNGVLLQRPFLTRTNTDLSYRAQLLMAKPRLSHRDAIMGLMTKKTTTSRNETVIPYISASRRDSFENFPKSRNRRSKGSGHEVRPSTAGNHGLRTNQNGQSRQSSSDEENAREILKRYDEGFRR